MQSELDALDGQGVNPADLRRAIEEFDNVWEELFPREKARVLGLLLEHVEYEASSSNVRLKIRAPGKQIDPLA